MLLRVGKFIGIGLAGLSLTQVAMAQTVAGGTAPEAEGKLVNVTTGSASARIGGEFRAEAIYDNHGLNKVSGQPSPKATTDLQVTDALITLQGDLNADTQYAFRFNLLNPSPTNLNQGPLDYGYGTHWFGKHFAFSIGKERIYQGGWDHMDYDYRTHAIGAYNDNLAMNDFDYMLGLHMKMGGNMLTLQVVNDVVAPDANGPQMTAGEWQKTTGEFNRDAHPTVVVAWVGDFGPIQPLVDYGTYDNNKSNWYDVSLKTHMAGLAATLGYWGSTHKHNNAPMFNPDGTAMAGVTTGTGSDQMSAINLNIAYEVKNVLTPWVYFSTFSNKQGGTDLKGNMMAPAMNPRTGMMDQNMMDNGMTWGLGTDFDNFGHGWNPFIALVSNSGKYYKTNTTDTETRSDMMVKVGVLGTL